MRSTRPRRSASDLQCTPVLSVQRSPNSTSSAHARACERQISAYYILAAGTTSPSDHNTTLRVRPAAYSDHPSLPSSVYVPRRTTTTPSVRLPAHNDHLLSFLPSSVRPPTYNDHPTTFSVRPRRTAIRKSRTYTFTVLGGKKSTYLWRGKSSMIYASSSRSIPVINKIETKTV